MEKQNFNIIIAGSRGFNDYNFMCYGLRKIDTIKCWLDFPIYRRKYNGSIISGTAQGADKLGEQWAQNHGFGVQRFPADWQAFGRRAGIIRNRQMAEHADMCVVFWDGKSKGTLNMIQTARDVGIPVYVFIYPKEVEE